VYFPVSMFLFLLFTAIFGMEITVYLKAKHSGNTVLNCSLVGEETNDYTEDRGRKLLRNVSNNPTDYKMA
jgi:hypothetical protein